MFPRGQSVVDTATGQQGVIAGWLNVGWFSRYYRVSMTDGPERWIDETQLAKAPAVNPLVRIERRDGKIIRLVRK